MRIRKSLSVYSAVLTLVACGAAGMSLMWYQDFKLSLGTKSYLYPSTDQTSLYLFEVSLNGESSLSEMSLDGQLLKQQSLTLGNVQHSVNGYFGKLVELSGNDAFIVESDLDKIIYADPDTGDYWKGVEADFLADNETLFLVNAWATVDDKMILHGQITRYEGSFKTRPILLLINKQAQIEKLVQFENYAGLGGISNGQQFVFSGTYTNSPEQAGQIEIYDKHLNLVSAFARPVDTTMLKAISSDKLMFVSYESAAEYAFDGTLIADNLSYDYSHYYYPDGQGGYYSLDDDYVGLSRPLLSPELRTVVAKYDAQGNKQWEKTLDQRADAPMRKIASVNQKGEFQLTLASSLTEVDGAFTQLVIDFEDEILSGSFDFDVTASDTYQVTHQVYSREGKRVKYLAEQKNQAFGNFVLCAYGYFCVDDERFSAGNADVNGVVYLDTGDIVSAVKHCNDEYSNCTNRVNSYSSQK